MTHWNKTRDANDLVWLSLDVEGRSVNVLTHEVLAELAGLVAELHQDANIKGLALLSGKAGGFVYGADVREFALFADESAVAEHIASVHSIFNQLANLPVPTAVGIAGVAVGGGLELSLCFDWIIGAPKIQCGFPEVNLGILPGYGGSGRAYRRVGAEAVLELMLTGKSLDAEKASEIGLVDALVASEADLRGELEAWLLAQGGKKPTPKTPPKTNIEATIKTISDKYLARIRPDHTPAPFAIIDHVRAHHLDPQAMSAGELDIFPSLLMSAASKGLRRLFDLRDRLRKAGRGESGVKRLHVIGAGVMGGDIAAVGAMCGFEVSLSDQDASAIDKALQRARAFYERRQADIATTLARLTADSAGEGIAEADLILEAVAENLEVKKSVCAMIESRARPDAILATNTSSIPLEAIAAGLTHPENLVGIHFFNPMPVLPLVEVIEAKTTAPDVMARALAFAGKLKKMPIRCRSAPGFLVNRALLPYIYGAIALMLDGVDGDRIDEAMVDFGMPMGPIELADQIGLDVTHDAGLPLGIDDAVAGALQKHIAAGNLGRKSGRGFYQWDGKTATRPRADYPMGAQAELAQKLLAPMVAQCRAAVAEGVVESADMADAGMIFGTGFPGFRGGVLFWAEGKNV